ncbi:MAG: C4-type zinc ribbon domain-containing protein [Thermoguttaceae bacterium]|nr:C4-type zinc ribbon domain-containing protein [Thermoguttaceae bacterium]MDW8038172.1 C4-type zinc ribbon domain-containing protein [Thermoguttaceae bacterium]
MDTSQSPVTLDLLRTLHRIHRQLADLRERLARGPRLIQARQAHVQRLAERLAQLQAEARAHRMAVDEKQLQLREGEEKVKRYQRQLNEAKTNAEYQALLEQIKAVKMANSVLEDEILEGLEKLDQFKLSLDQAQADLAVAKAELEKLRQDVQNQQPILEAEIRRVEAELAQQEKFLSEDIRDIYYRLLRQRGEQALAPVEGQSCGGCHQQVPINMISKIKLNEVVFCKSCGRLLYLPE